MNIKEKPKEFTKRQKRIIGIIVILLLFVFCGVVTLLIGKPMIQFVSQPEKFREWIEAKGLFGKIAFIGMMIFQVIIALVPGEPLEIGAGYAFGMIEGVLLCTIGITLGSIIVFTLVRKFGIRLVELFFDTNKIGELKILKDSKKRNALIFLVFFLPGTPKDLLTYFVGLTDIRLSHFILLASLARIPSVITSAAGGGALGASEYKTAVIVFIITLFISLLGWLIYKLILKNKRSA